MCLQFSGMDSVEYRIFKDEYAFLHEGIKSELDKLVPKAYSAGLIGSATEDAATLITWTSDQKANSLLKAIDSRIKTDSRAFYDFLEVLMSLPTLRFFADRLNGRLPPELQLKIASSRASQGHDLCQSHDDASNSEGSLRPVLAYDPRNMTFMFRLTSSNAHVTFHPLPPSSATSVNYVAATHDIDEAASVVPAPLLGLETLISEIPDHVLNHPCEDVPLAEIARLLDNHQTIYMYLNISDIEMTDITTEHRQPLRQRQVLLQKWKEKIGSLATYKKLIDCFRKAHRPDLISVTCKVLKANYPSISEEIVDFAAAAPDIDGAAERTASQQPSCVPSQDPLPKMIPFQKQQSQLQVSLGSSVEEAALDLPRIFTTQPSEPAEQDYQMCAGLRLDIQPPVENGETKQKSRSSPQLLSPVSTHSSDSPLDSFKTARSHISPTSTPEGSDEEFESDLKKELKEIAEKELNRIAEKCTKRFSQKKQQIKKLKQKLEDKEQQLRGAQQQFDQKEEALKQLEQCLAEKEQQLATQIPYPQQETEPQLIELKTKKIELRLTQEHLKEVEDERKSLARKLFDAEESLHCLKKQLLDTKIQLVTSHREAHDHKMENIILKQRIRELENRIDFIFENAIVCSRRRSQSV